MEAPLDAAPGPVVLRKKKPRVDLAHIFQLAASKKAPI